jgi:hypothetical protein
MTSMQGAVVAPATSPSAARSGDRRKRRIVRGREALSFSDGTQRARQVDAFLRWLPAMVRDAPGIAWERLPSRVMGYLIGTVADAPDAAAMALALGTAMHGYGPMQQHSRCAQLYGLLRQLRAAYGVRRLADLADRSVWLRFMDGRTLRPGETHWLAAYIALTDKYLPAYLESLTAAQRQALAPHVLPRMPASVRDEVTIHMAAVGAAARKRRRSQSDVLVPLLPLLVELAQFRAHLGRRLHDAYRIERARVERGEIALPHRFTHHDRLRTVNEEALTLADVRVQERDVALSFTLWDRHSWIASHPDRYTYETKWQARQRRGAYCDEVNHSFLEYTGDPDDLLWFGHLLRLHLLQDSEKPSDEQRAYLRAHGEMMGFRTHRPGVLSAEQRVAVWLRHAARDNDILFDPEALYRGILYGAALATLAMTNGSRMVELLQVSATRFTELRVPEMQGERPTGRTIPILVQHLLPKGCRREQERQLFLVVEQVVPLLEEIIDGLEAAHSGAIPVVQPLRSNKQHDLGPEPYLFQWNASADGARGALDQMDVNLLIRFLFHGLRLRTRDGTVIRVNTHLLRHVMATDLRQTGHVPAEAVAFILHHRIADAPGPSPWPVPAATSYYSGMTEEMRLGLVAARQAALATARVAVRRVQTPAPAALDLLMQHDEELAEVIEHWGTIAPTVFGYCKAGLCVRRNNRAHCLGCPYLVPHHDNLWKVARLRRMYLTQQEFLDADGNWVDAKQARQAVQDLDDLAALMRIQMQARHDGRYTPLVERLAVGEPREGEEHD